MLDSIHLVQLKLRSGYLFGLTPFYFIFPTCCQVISRFGYNTGCLFTAVSESAHYENLPMQGAKIENFTGKIVIFNIFAQNIDYGYTLEPSCRGGSNEYPQFMFWIKNKKNRYTPVLVP